jgi:hypothetical protein
MQAKFALISVAGAAAFACGNGGGGMEPRAANADSDSATQDSDAATGDAGADGDAEPPEAGGCPGPIFSEDFENYPAGSALAPIWRLSVEGPNSSARINLDAEGHGNAGSNRYALFSNNGSEPNSVRISATTPALDVSGCGSVSLTMGVIVFSLEETENDHAFVEVRGNGSDWVPMYMPFPSPDFPPLASCRAGGQETGCVAWKTFRVDVPRVAQGPDLEVRFRLDARTGVSDFFGFDTVTISGAP